jgi:superfamily II DNA or RNA helicase
MSFADALALADRKKEDDILEEKEDIPIPTDLINQRKIHQAVSFNTTYKLRPKQIPILKEAEEELLKNGTICLQLCTGFGKSIGLTHLIKMTGLLSVILATQTQNIDQLKKTVQNNTDAVVWVPGSGKSKPPPGVQVIITTPRKFKHVPQDIVNQIGTLAIDESPLICVPTSVDALLALRVRYIISCSATIRRRNGMHCMLDMLHGPAKVIKNLDLPIKVIRWYTGIRVPYFPGKKGPDWGQHCDYICGHEERNKMIIEFARRIIKAPDGSLTDIVSNAIRKASSRTMHKIIMITNRVEDHVNVLVPLMKSAGLTADYVTTRKHSYDDSQVVVGTSQKMGIGFDVATSAKNYDGNPADVVFTTVSSATKELIIQQLGRGCRVEDYPAIYIMMIDNNRISAKHARTAEEVFNELDQVEYFDIRGNVFGLDEREDV